MLARRALVGLFAGLATGCDEANKAQGRSTSKPNGAGSPASGTTPGAGPAPDAGPGPAPAAGPAPSPGPGPDPGPSPGPGPASDPLTDCSYLGRPKVTFEAGMTPAELAATTRIYGSEDSAMVAVHYAAYVDSTAASKLVAVLVCRTDGTVLAMHRITAADRKGGLLRPIVIDALRVSAAAGVLVVAQTADKKLYKHVIAVDFVHTFQGLPVKDLGARSVPTNHATHHTFVNFAETTGTFHVDAGVSYPTDFNMGSPRNLQTVKSTSTWTRGMNMKGTVTDVMGNPLTGNYVLEHQTICAYVLDSGVYYRTMLRIG